MRNIKLQNKEYLIKITPEYGSEIFLSDIELINDYIKKLKIPNGLIIDIGANQGVISLLLRDNIPNNGIVCIEPVSENVEYIKYNLPDAVIYPLAISNINSTGSLHNPFSSNQCYRLNKTSDGDVFISTLDNLNIKDAMLIKIDVEGAEIDVLEGAVATIEKYKPIIYLEHHWDLVDKDTLYSQIEKINYKIIYLDGRTEYVHGVINNYILIPK